LPAGWAEPDRDSEGNLVVNRERFPGGLKKLADYIHARGLRFGLYSSAGAFTCQKREEGGFPGALDHEMQPATITVEATELGLQAAGHYAVRDLWRHTSRDSTAAISARVSAHATELYRIRARIT
jgi:hypothetical protein